MVWCDYSFFHRQCVYEICVVLKSTTPNLCSIYICVNWMHFEPYHIRFSWREITLISTKAVHICGAFAMRIYKASYAFPEHYGAVQVRIPGLLSAMEMHLNCTCVLLRFQFRLLSYYRSWLPLSTMYCQTRTSQLLKKKKNRSWALQMCIKNALEPLNKCFFCSQWKWTYNSQKTRG